MADSTQAGMRNSTRNSVQNGMRKSAQNGSTLKDIDKDREKENPPISPVCRFGDFLDAYPKRAAARPGAQYAYCRVLREDCRITEQDLVEAAANYAEAVRILGRTEKYIRSPESFLTDNFFAGYLPGQYVRPEVGAKKGQKNSFNNFAQNTYDFAALEEELLENG